MSDRSCTTGDQLEKVSSAWCAGFRAARVLLSMALIGALGSCVDRAERPPDILLISVDTLRPDHMSVYGYARSTTPQLERFFRDAAIFDRAYATSSFTTASMVSALSGLLPQDHGVRLFDQLLPESTQLVSELLPPAYQSAAFVSNGVLSDGGIGMANRFDHFDDEMSRSADTHRLERGAVATTDAVLGWLERERDPDRPVFLWVHYMDPHAPYDPPRGALYPAAPLAMREGAREVAPVVFDAATHPDVDPLERIAAYDAEIAHTDAQIGRLLEGYALAGSKGAAPVEGALVVFSADHGESLAERQSWFVHAKDVFEEQVRVPLLIRAPGVEAGRRTRLVSGLDLAPTILAFAGVSGGSLPGRDLLAVRPDPAADTGWVSVESVHNLDGSQWRALITEEGKWVVRLRRKGEKVSDQHFFDLRNDPGELSPLPWPGEQGRALLDLVRADPDPAGKPDRFEKGVLTEENAEILRALGYID